MTRQKSSGNPAKSRKLKLKKETVRDLDVRRPVKGASGDVCQQTLPTVRPASRRGVTC